MNLLGLTLRSLGNRAFTALLTLLTLTVSICLLMAVEKVRYEARASFASTISGTDLIVGARTGPVQLLLYSVFHIGNATNNISWKSYQDVAADPGVAWTIPISLGDSHKGFPVMGTTPDYFTRYHFARTHSLAFAQGKPFEDVYDAVLGAEVAKKLGYRVGDPIVIAHGMGNVSLVKHADKPFVVTGILEGTGTPVDRTVHISLEAMSAIHLGWQSGAPLAHVSAEEARHMDLTPHEITAFMVGLKSKIQTFRLQRAVDEYPEEPLLAIIPGVALSQLWELVGVAENALLVVSAFVVVAGLIGMLAVILASLNERRREMAILRAMGARPGQVFLLLLAEAAALGAAGCVLGVVLLNLGVLVARPFVATRYGLYLGLAPPSLHDWLVLSLVMAATLVVGAVPAYRAYRYSLADGMTVRV